jgi:hypothetical protein
MSLKRRPAYPRHDRVTYPMVGFPMMHTRRAQAYTFRQMPQSCQHHFNGKHVNRPPALRDADVYRQVRRRMLRSVQTMLMRLSLGQCIVALPT